MMNYDFINIFNLLNLLISSSISHNLNTTHSVRCCGWKQYEYNLFSLCKYSHTCRDSSDMHNWAPQKTNNFIWFIGRTKILGARKWDTFLLVWWNIYWFFLTRRICVVTEGLVGFFYARVLVGRLHSSQKKIWGCGKKLGEWYHRKEIRIKKNRGFDV